MARFFQATPSEPAFDNPDSRTAWVNHARAAPGAEYRSASSAPRNYRPFTAATRPRTFRHLRAGMTANNP